jgi:glycosyltransferase involved in cell wall biosynthesis
VPSILPPGFTLLQVTPRLVGGGVERATLDMAGAVAKAGYRSIVAAYGGGDAPGDVVDLPVHSRNPAVMVANAGRLARLIREHGVSLVHVRSRAPAFSAIAAARLAGVPVVATYHGIYSAGSPLKRWYNGVMTRGDLVIANSKFTRDHILGQHPVSPERVVVVPEGIDTERFDPAAVSPDRIAAVRAAWGLAPDDRRRVLLCAARLTSWKGQGTAIQALAARARRENAVLILAGREESATYVAALRAVAAERGVTGAVVFAGPVADMPAALLAADLVLAPSTKAESFGRATSCGCAPSPAMAWTPWRTGHSRSIGVFSKDDRPRRHPGDQAFGLGRHGDGLPGLRAHPRRPSQRADHPADDAALRGACEGQPLFRPGLDRRPSERLCRMAQARIPHPPGAVRAGLRPSGQRPHESHPSVPSTLSARLVGVGTGGNPSSGAPRPPASTSRNLAGCADRADVRPAA